MIASRRHRALPQHLHLMPARARLTRLCDATTGGFVRLNAEGWKWLRKFLADGGGLCPECARLDAAPLNTKVARPVDPTTETA